jgi:hypothetical protein
MERISIPQSPEMSLEYDLANQAEFGPCPDCAQMTKRVWGYAYRGDVATAAYFVEWTPGHSPKDATFDLIVGRWGEATGSNDRRAVSVAFRVLESGPSFMVQDASSRPIASSSLVSRALDRVDVVGQPIAADVFQICDFIYLADPRIGGLRN